MVVNEPKTQMMVINGTAADRYDFRVGNVVVKHTVSYIYLGSPFTENGKLIDVISLHVKSRVKDLNKFKIFCRKNETMPYVFKRTVLEAVIVSSLLYGSETWLMGSLKEVDKMYVSAVKSLLGVRETTRNDTSLIEAGLPSIEQLVKKRTSAFIKKKLFSDRTADTPLIKIYRICERKRTKGFKYLNSLLNPLQQQDLPLCEKFRQLSTSKAVVYRKMNPDLSVHKAYLTNEYIDERERLAFTRFRLCSHRLKIETGRWARIDVENRLCSCGNGIQDEEHVLFHCSKTEEERRLFGVDGDVVRDMGVLMSTMEVHDLVSFVFNCMEHFS